MVSFFYFIFFLYICRKECIMEISEVKKGLFITNISEPDSFAILYGCDYLDFDTKEKEQILFCYYYPLYFEKGENGEWESTDEVFSYEMAEDFESCEYTIPNKDLQYWRPSNQYEIQEYIQQIRSFDLVWDSKNCKFICIGKSKNKRVEPIVKLDDLVLDKEWNQTEPIGIMDKDRKEFICDLCFYY